MKKYFLAFAFIVAYATFLSIGFECMLNLLGMSVAISLDGPPVTKQYPRFIPFCFIVGIFALASIIVTFILNLKASERLGFTKKIWWMEMVISFVVSIPMIKPWEMLFEFLQKTILPFYRGKELVVLPLRVGTSRGCIRLHRSGCVKRFSLLPIVGGVLCSVFGRCAL